MPKTTPQIYRSLRVPEILIRRIEEIINEYPELGYTNISDFVKDAIRRRLEELEKRIESISFSRIKKESEG